jgi:hypothetical protein
MAAHAVCNHEEWISLFYQQRVFIDTANIAAMGLSRDLPIHVRCILREWSSGLFDGEPEP